MSGRVGLAGTFADFRLLPDLLALPVMDGDEENTVVRWADLLEDMGANRDHEVAEEMPKGDRAQWLGMAEDAVMLCMDLKLFDLDAEYQGSLPDEWENALHPILPERVRANFLAEDGSSIVALLQRTARGIADSGKEWAKWCPGLLLAEFMRIVELACVDAPAAEEFAGSLLSMRKEAAVKAGLGKPKKNLRAQVNRVAYGDAIASHLQADGAGTPPAPAMRVTEGRATAMLLTYTELLGEAFGEGPFLSCLVHPEYRVPPMPENCAPVVLGNKFTWYRGDDPWMVASDLLHLMGHETKVIQGPVASVLGIDAESRRLTGTTVSPGSDTETNADTDTEGKKRRILHEQRKINKGLAMELLCSMLLAHLDKATEVRPNCEVSERRPYLPYRFAPTATVDISADYGGTQGVPAIQLVAEVTAKDEVSPGFFLAQAGQAVKHARKLHERTRRPVYALTINGGRIGEDAELAKAFKDFAASEGVGIGAPVRLVPLCANDLAEAVRKLVRLEPDGLRFDSDVLVEIFDDLLKQLHGGLEADVEPGWMAETWVQVVKRRRSGSVPSEAPAAEVGDDWPRLEDYDYGDLP